jgi:GxxExxY protein
VPSVLHAEQLTNHVLGAFYDVYNALRYGYLEQVYLGALEVEFTDRGLPFLRERILDVVYRGHVVGRYRADFVVDESLIVEVKAGRSLADSARWQTLNYLRASGVSVGLVLHFGPKPSFRRIVF